MRSLFANPDGLTEISEAEEVKQITLGILLHIKSFCENNKIRYYLGYGTLLGAIRHKGYIPWDDDIDILMPRDDYNRFINLHKECLDGYISLNPLNKGYYYNYSKVVDSRTALFENGCKPIHNMGIYVDIFPLDGMPNDRKMVMKQLKKLIRLRKKISSFGHAFPRLRKNIFAYIRNVYECIFCHFHDLEDYQKKYLKEAYKYEYEDSKFVYATGGAYGAKSVFHKEWFSGEVIAQFEGYSFYVPVGFDGMLQQLYDNYMELPPENKRVSRHRYKAFYKPQTIKEDINHINTKVFHE